MARWTDVRVASEDSGRALQAITDQCGVISFVLDPNPPASGPEAEIQVENIGSRRVRAALESADVEVLAIRQRVDPSLGALFRTREWS